MKNQKIKAAILTGVIAAVAVIFMPASADAQILRNQNRYNKNYVSGVITRLETSSNQFRRDFDRAMDRSNLNGTDAEDRFNGNVADYEDSLDRLRSEFDRRNSWWETRDDVSGVIREAQTVNTMMNQLSFRRTLERQWNRMRTDLNTLADTYDMPGLNGGGWNGGSDGGNWNGGGNNGGGWNGGNNSGQMSPPPSWARGTFYSTNIQGFTMNVNADGNVSVENVGQTLYGRYYRGSIYINDDVFRISKSRDGLTASNQNQSTNYSRNAPGYDNGGGTGNGETSRPPNWAIGTFNSVNVDGFTMTIDNSGNVTMYSGGQTTYGRYNNGVIFINNYEYPVTRSGNGMRALDRNTGQYTNYRRQ